MDQVCVTHKILNTRGSTGPKYKYAIGKDNSLVDILDIPKGYRNSRKRDEFTCFGCGRPLMARPGNRNAPHFAHYPTEEEFVCNGQTYLHRAGILKFKEEFERRIENGDSFSFEIKSTRICDHETCPFGRTEFCKEECFETVQVLPGNYTICEKETNDNGLYPDILLKNEQGDKIYVEIFVSHQCSEDKIARGIPIVEIKLNTEDDLNLLVQDVISERDERVKCFNFREAEQQYNFECEEKVDACKQNFLDCLLKLKENKKPWNISYETSVVCSDTSCLFSPSSKCYQKHQENFNIADDFWEVLPDEGTPDVYLKNLNGRVIRLNFTMELLPYKKNAFDGMETIQLAVNEVDDDIYASFPRISKGNKNIQFFNFKYDSYGKMSCESIFTTLYILDRKGLVRCKGVLSVTETENTLKKLMDGGELVDYLILRGECELNKKENELLPALFLKKHNHICSCYLCEHYSSDGGNWNSQTDYGFCLRKKKDKEIYHNEADTCINYEPNEKKALYRLKQNFSERMQQMVREYEENRLKK